MNVHRPERRFSFPARIVVSAVLCSSGAPALASSSADPERQPPLYTSTADTVFDIIRTDDPSDLVCVKDEGMTLDRIWDKRVDGEPVVGIFSFRAHFKDGRTVRIAVNAEFGSTGAAAVEARRYARILGQIPDRLRNGVARLSLHKGREGFHAGPGQIVAYQGTAEDRIETDHLEETVFHEAVHAAWDEAYRLSTEWRAVQQQDGRFLTDYAREQPEREDLAETALFAYGLLLQPGRIPPVDTADIENAVPHRLRFLSTLLVADDAKETKAPEEPDPDCGAD